MTKLQHLPEEVLSLWSHWEIRGMVILSLLLQIILILLGSQRKTIARSWIWIVWSAYLSADMVATVALGNLACKQRNLSGHGSTESYNSIQAFWAPFLLLHLGGPDTITAYSVEDNELWLRRLLDLVVQAGVAFYVLSTSLGSRVLTFIAIPVLIAGIIKYAERIWVLRSSCSSHLKDSFLSKESPSRLEDRLAFSESIPQRNPYDWEGSYLLRQAYFLFPASRFLMQGLPPHISDLVDREEIIYEKSTEDAFHVVEIELGLIYNSFYTKAPLIYSSVGIILRSVSFLSSLTALVTFAIMMEKHACSPADVTITYLLLVGALVLEIYAFLCLVFSDWTLIWLSSDEDKGAAGGRKSTPPAARRNIRRTTCSFIGNLTPRKKWSRSMAQYNLINSCIENKPVKCLEMLGIHELVMKQMHVNWEEVNPKLQDFIFKHLKREK